MTRVLSGFTFTTHL